MSVVEPQRRLARDEERLYGVPTLILINAMCVCAQLRAPAPRRFLRWQTCWVCQAVHAPLEGLDPEEEGGSIRDIRYEAPLPQELSRR